MAERGYVRAGLEGHPAGAVVIRWDSVAQNDSCAPVTIPWAREAYLQAIPAAGWGAGDTVSLEGSLQDNVAAAAAAYGPVGDQGGNGIILTSKAIVYVGGLAIHYRPVPAGSTGTTWTIYLVVVPQRLPV